MAMLGFGSGGEFALFVTALVAGVTLIIGVNAVNSAPAFMLDYYKYLQDNPDATATYATFWAKVLTFYTVVTEVTQGILEPLNLTPFMCRFSLMFRLQTSSVLMIVELLIILIMPHTHVSEARAVAGIIVAAFIGGVGRAYFENTTFALFGPCPSKHMSSLMVGISVSGCISSIAQLILLSTMSSTYDSVRLQSIIYFTVALAIIVICALLLIVLHCNAYAKRYIAELRAHGGGPWARIYIRVDAAASDATTTHEQLRSNGSEKDVAGDAKATVSPATGEPVRDAAVALADDDAKCARTDSSSSSSSRDGNMTTSMLIQGVRLRDTVRKVYPMLLTCFGVYFVTYILYPGALIAVDPHDKWFTTVLVAVYHFGDIAGRSLTLWRRLWLPRRLVTAGAVARVVFIPLMVLCALHKIPTHTAAYVIAGLVAVSNGFLGTLTMVYTPATHSLLSEGERVIAGQLAGVCLLIGVSGGSLLQLAVVLPFK